MLENNFCSSPWFHMQILNDGTMDYCRWNFGAPPVKSNLARDKPQEFFQQQLAPVRWMLLQGQPPEGCSSCKVMEQHGKVSGRQKQLLKVGIRTDHFVPTALNSDWHPVFMHSAEQQGRTQQMPQDWQVHLGNHCNSACVFCVPEASSRLAAEQLKLGMIDRLPAENWSNRPELVSRFIEALDQSPVKYLHFIGGETLITPAFRTILQQLVTTERSGSITLGFTTNLTVWDPEITDLLTQFQDVHVGMSVECLDTVNDYVRWPSHIDDVMQTLDRWCELILHRGWYGQLRTTPTCLSVANLITVYDYAWKKNIPVESCNFLENPAFMRPTVLPMPVREQIACNIESWCQQRPNTQHQVINTRDPGQARVQLTQDLASYCDYLRTAPDESHRLPELAQYLARLDRNRGNSVLDYLPQYADILRTAGY